MPATRPARVDSDSRPLPEDSLISRRHCAYIVLMSDARRLMRRGRGHDGESRHFASHQPDRPICARSAVLLQCRLPRTYTLIR